LHRGDPLLRSKPLKRRQAHLLGIHAEHLGCFFGIDAVKLAERGKFVTFRHLVQPLHAGTKSQVVGTKLAMGGKLLVEGNIKAHSHDASLRRRTPPFSRPGPPEATEPPGNPGWRPRPAAIRRQRRQLLLKRLKPSSRRRQPDFAPVGADVEEANAVLDRQLLRQHAGGFRLRPSEGPVDDDPAQAVVGDLRVSGSSLARGPFIGGKVLMMSWNHALNAGAGTFGLL
jgi:hypothetical protein